VLVLAGMLKSMTLEEALREIARLQEENAQLRARLQELEQQWRPLAERLDELERAAKRQAAPFRRREEKKVPPAEQKKPGRKPGHPGAQRMQPRYVDERINVPLSACPQCQGPVEDCRPIRQFIEEIPPLRPHVVQLTTWQGRCPQCGEVHSSHPLQVSRAQGAAGVHLGPRAAALATLLNKHLGLTKRKTCKVLQQGFGLRLTPGGLSQLLTRVARKLAGRYEQLLEEIRGSTAVYADETSWWVGGSGWWLWVFATPERVLYQIASSRGGPVAEKVLGKEFQGVLVSDNFAAYNRFTCPQHKCIAHHLQAIKKARDKPRTKDPTYLDAWQQLLQETVALAHARDELPPAVFALQHAQLEIRADDLLAQQVTQPGDVAVRTRLTRAQPHLFGCLKHRVDPTNNRAERALRGAVIARKLSCGNKTERGAQTWQILASLAATAYQQGRDFLQNLALQLPLLAPAG
jgi:transposase